MAISTSNGTVYSAPRIVQTYDTRSGCPGTAADGSILISQTITVSKPAVYWTHGRIIFNAGNAGKSRADFNLRVNGTVVKYALNTALNSSGGLAGWDELDASRMGNLSAGTHTITMYGSNGSNCWGCGSDWGHLITMIWELE